MFHSANSGREFRHRIARVYSVGVLPSCTTLRTISRRKKRDAGLFHRGMLTADFRSTTKPRRFPEIFNHKERVERKEREGRRGKV